MIVAYRAPVLLTGRTSREEKSPIHVADVMKMREAILRLRKSSDGKSVERGATSEGVERLVEDKRDKFEVRESPDLSEGEEQFELENRNLSRDADRLDTRSMMLSRVAMR